MAMSNSDIMGNVNLLLLFRDSQLRVGFEEMLNFELLNTAFEPLRLKEILTVELVVFC